MPCEARLAGNTGAHRELSTRQRGCRDRRNKFRCCNWRASIVPTGIDPIQTNVGRHGFHQATTMGDDELCCIALRGNDLVQTQYRYWFMRRFHSVRSGYCNGTGRVLSTHSFSIRFKQAAKAHRDCEQLLFRRKRKERARCRGNRQRPLRARMAHPFGAHFGLCRRCCASAFCFALIHSRTLNYLGNLAPILK